jgi:hypothetical protein
LCSEGLSSNLAPKTWKVSWLKSIIVSVSHYRNMLVVPITLKRPCSLPHQFSFINDSIIHCCVLWQARTKNVYLSKWTSNKISIVAYYNELYKQMSFPWKAFITKISLKRSVALPVPAGRSCFMWTNHAASEWTKIIAVQWWAMCEIFRLL